MKKKLLQYLQHLESCYYGASPPPSLYMCVSIFAGMAAYSDLRMGMDAWEAAFSL
jgi:hypothetical protein